MLFYCSGTFRWTEKKDLLLMREARMLRPFCHKSGTPESGQKWSAVAENLNTHQDFAEMPRDQRSVRERFNKRFKDFKAKLAKEEKASGINVPPPTEVETLMEEIKELMDSHVPAPSKKADSERKKGLKLREKSMTTWGEGKFNDDEESTESSEPRRKRNRRKASDPLEYLSTRREEEMDLKRQQMELEAKRIEIEQQRQAQLQEQMVLQNQQMQQQMSMMLALLQQNMNKH